MIEVEIEWRRRITLAEAQRILFSRIRGQNTVYLENYRVRNHGEIHKRLGERTVFRDGAFNFATYEELLNRLKGPFAGTSEHRHANTSISIAKLTTCFHTYFFFDENVSLQRNNEYPRIFVCKAAEEIEDWHVYKPRSPTFEIPSTMKPNSTEVSDCDNNTAARTYDEFQSQDSSNCENRTPNVYRDTSKLLDELIDLDAMKRKLAEYEAFEMDRSDNNLGLRFYRKLYYFTDRQVRVCLYSILDEFGTVRYEIGVERELDNDDDDHHHHNAVGNFAEWTLIRKHMQQCSETIESLSSLFTYTECPMINLTTGWMHDVNTSSAILRSLACNEEDVQHINRYESLFERLLKQCTGTQPPFDEPRYLLKLKIDGTRVFGVYDGATRLCLSNGVELDLHEYCPFVEHDHYRELFSTDLIYQLEHIRTTDRTDHYFFTEILEIRNRFTNVIQPPLHGYSAAVQRYKRQPCQEWPFNVIGTTLANNADCLAKLIEAKEHSCRTVGWTNNTKSSTASLFPSSSSRDKGTAAINEKQTPATLWDKLSSSTNVNGGNDGGARKSQKFSQPLPSQQTTTHGFLGVSFNESRAMLQKLAHLIETKTKMQTRRLHVNLFHRVEDLLPRMLDQRFARFQFLASYRQLIEIFSTDKRDNPVCQHLIDRCQTIMLSSDWQTLSTMRILPRKRQNFRWFYEFDVREMFNYIDGCIIYRYPRKLKKTARNNPHCRCKGLKSGQLEAYKLKTFQTIELMYAERRNTNLSVVREFKTDDFYNKSYFSQPQERTESSVWQRFDGTSVSLFVPHQFQPLIRTMIYEILCENKTTFYLVKIRRDKSIPDSNFKVNSIVFCRTTLNDRLLHSVKPNSQRKKRTFHEATKKNPDNLNSYKTTNGNDNCDGEMEKVKEKNNTDDDDDEEEDDDDDDEEEEEEDDDDDEEDENSAATDVDGSSSASIDCDSEIESNNSEPSGNNNDDDDDDNDYDDNNEDFDF